MKLFWFSLMAFYVIYQKHPAVTASPSDYLLTDTEEKLMSELGIQISNILNATSTAMFSLEDDDPPLVQNFTKIYVDESSNGNMLLYDTIIDDLTEINRDVTTIDQDKQEIRMAVNLPQLVVDGKFIFATPSDVDDETGTFTVTSSNVRIEGIASLMDNPNGDMVVTKVVSTIRSKELHVAVEPRTAVISTLLKSATAHLENNVKKQFARIANIEVSTHYPRKSRQPPSKIKWTIFEAKRFLDQYYDPYRVETILLNGGPSLSSFFGPIHFYGLSNLHLDEVVMAVNNSAINVYVRVLINAVHVNFPLSLYQNRYNGECSIKKMDFIGKIKLVTDDSKHTPIMDGLGMEMTGCECYLRNKATGMRVKDDEFGFDDNDLFCVLIRSTIPTLKIVEKIQTEIFDKMDLGRLKEAMTQVLYEDQLLSEWFE